MKLSDILRSSALDIQREKRPPLKFFLKVGEKTRVRFLQPLDQHDALYVHRAFTPAHYENDALVPASMLEVPCWAQYGLECPHCAKMQPGELPRIMVVAPLYDETTQSQRVALLRYQHAQELRAVEREAGVTIDRIWFLAQKPDQRSGLRFSPLPNMSPFKLAEPSIVPVAVPLVLLISDASLAEELGLPALRDFLALWRQGQADPLLQVVADRERASRDFFGEWLNRLRSGAKSGVESGAPEEAARMQPKPAPAPHPQPQPRPQPHPHPVPSPKPKPVPVPAHAQAQTPAQVQAQQKMEAGTRAPSFVAATAQGGSTANAADAADDLFDGFSLALEEMPGGEAGVDGAGQELLSADSLPL